ncbi:MAG: DUF1015 domain-containing protein [Lachnospiraceae bacterium]|nr:DUF1015 domain-containing protein [Lachnospiraceae bacterium]
MAILRPFRALRPAPEVVKDVAALPYDVYNRAEATEFVKNRPLSFLNIDRAETGFDESVSTYDDRVYARADRLLREFEEKGIFIQEKEPCYYVYSLTMGDITETGLVALSSVDDYLNNVILKHENTRADKEADRIRHVSETSAQTGPIFLAYRDVPEISAMIRRATEEKPLYDFTAEDGIRHVFWRIGEAETVEKITGLFANVPHTYIADGHHRAASAVKVGVQRRAAKPGFTGNEEFNYFLSVLFPESELRIFDYNRVVKDLNGRSSEEFLSEIGKCFKVEAVSKEGTPYRPENKGDFGLLLDGTWYRLTVREEVLEAVSGDPVKSLDVSILQEYLLRPVLGIEDPKTDKRIDFVGGIRGLKELERRVHTDMKLAISMYPTSMQELLSVADAGLLMPPKSTWFEPKLRSGIAIHKIER